MAKEYLRNIILCGVLFLKAMSWNQTMDTSLEVAVEGDRIVLKCTTNSSFGIDWKFKNATNEYSLYNEGIVPKRFRTDYSVMKDTFSSNKTFYLSIATVKEANVGTYTCMDGDTRQIQTSVQLALLTIPKCEPDTTIRRSVCNFTYFGNLLPRQGWIEDFCSNSTPTTCSDSNEENKIHCELPINRTNGTRLPFKTIFMYHERDACELTCKHWENTSNDGSQTSRLNMAIQISVLLQCSVNLNRTVTTTAITSTTSARFLEPIRSEWYLYGSIAAALTGVLLTLIIIAIFRNADACPFRRKLRYIDNKKQSPAAQIAEQSYYHELEAPYAEIEDFAIVDNIYIYHGSEPIQNDNNSCDSGSTSNKGVRSPMHIENHQSSPEDTSRRAAAVVNQECTVPYDSMVTLSDNDVYQK